MRDIPEDKEAKNTWYNDAFFSIPRPPNYHQFGFEGFEIEGVRYDVHVHIDINQRNPVDTAFLTCFGKRYPILPLSQIKTDVENRLQEQKNNVTP